MCTLGGLEAIDIPELKRSEISRVAFLGNDIEALPRRTMPDSC